MFVVAVAFVAVFFFRDVQILVTEDRKLLQVRLGVYAALLAIGTAAFEGAVGSQPGWMERRFALWAMVIQLAELAIALLLERYHLLGRHSWVGCILPCPAFLVALWILSFEYQYRHPGADGISIMKIVLVAWLLIVAGVTSALSLMKDPWGDRTFAADFALMTSCTALIFVPFGLS